MKRITTTAGAGATVMVREAYQEVEASFEDDGLRLTDNVKLPDGTGLAVETLWKRLY